MNSIILRVTSHFLFIVMLIFSIWVLIRGHNGPGGGFIAGLITASAFSLYIMAHGIEKVKKVVVLELTILLCLGLICVLLSSVMPWLKGLAFLTALWLSDKFFLGTPLLFDLGIYLVVVGGLLIIMVALEEGST